MNEFINIQNKEGIKSEFHLLPVANTHVTLLIIINTILVPMYQEAEPMRRVTKMLIKKGMNYKIRFDFGEII